jgi:5-formyltetrahydrofolate cyclo-ligase
MVDRFKQALRLSRRQIRESLALDYQHSASAKICARIRNLEQYRHAKRIALYQPINGEISLNAIWSSAPLQGKFCYFPALHDDKTLIFLPATPATPFIKNHHGIDEPDVARSEAISPRLLDIIFLPLVAFDDYGTRLGMGAGYYDRTLAQLAHPMLIGAAYEFQHCSYIEPQSWDIPLTAVVTENKTHWSRK